jgi:hypothetical protein
MKAPLAAALGALVFAAASSADPGSRACASVPLPSGWQAAGRVTLIVTELTVPRNQSIVFRVVAVDGADRETFLGSFGIVGISAGASGQTRHEAVRVNVTSALARWSRSNPTAANLPVCVEPIDGARRVLTDLPWTMGAIMIDLQ